MPAPLVEDAFFFPLYTFGFFVKNQVSVGVWIYVWVLDFDSLINLSVFMPIPSGFSCSGSAVELEIRDGETSSCSLTV